jgi:hypothetical protein
MFICGSKELEISNRETQNGRGDRRFSSNLALYHRLSIIMNDDDDANDGSLQLSDGYSFSNCLQFRNRLTYLRVYSHLLFPIFSRIPSKKTLAKAFSQSKSHALP